MTFNIQDNFQGDCDLGECDGMAHELGSLHFSNGSGRQWEIVERGAVLPSTGFEYDIGCTYCCCCDTTPFTGCGCGFDPGNCYSDGEGDHGNGSVFPATTTGLTGGVDGSGAVAAVTDIGCNKHVTVDMSDAHTDGAGIIFCETGSIRKFDEGGGTSTLVVESEGEIHTLTGMILGGLSPNSLQVEFWPFEGRIRINGSPTGEFTDVTDLPMKNSGLFGFSVGALGAPHEVTPSAPGTACDEVPFIICDVAIEAFKIETDTEECGNGEPGGCETCSECACSELIGIEVPTPCTGTPYEGKCYDSVAWPPDAVPDDATGVIFVDSFDYEANVAAHQAWEDGGSRGEEPLYYAIDPSTWIKKCRDTITKARCRICETSELIGIEVGCEPHDSAGTIGYVDSFELEDSAVTVIYVEAPDVGITCGGLPTADMASWTPTVRDSETHGPCVEGVFVPHCEDNCGPGETNGNLCTWWRANEVYKCDGAGGHCTLTMLNEGDTTLNNTRGYGLFNKSSSGIDPINLDAENACGSTGVCPDVNGNPGNIHIVKPTYSPSGSEHWFQQIFNVFPNSEIAAIRQPAASNSGEIPPTMEPFVSPEVVGLDGFSVWFAVWLQEEPIGVFDPDTQSLFDSGLGIELYWKFGTTLGLAITKSGMAYAQYGSTKVWLPIKQPLQRQLFFLVSNRDGVMTLSERCSPPPPPVLDEDGNPHWFYQKEVSALAAAGDYQQLLRAGIADDTTGHLVTEKRWMETIVFCKQRTDEANEATLAYLVNRYQPGPCPGRHTLGFNTVIG